MTAIEKRILVLQSKADKEPDIVKRGKILKLIAEIKEKERVEKWLAQ